MKKFIALVLALALVFCMQITTLAAQVTELYSSEMWATVSSNNVSEFYMDSRNVYEGEIVTNNGADYSLAIKSFSSDDASYIKTFSGLQQNTYYTVYTLVKSDVIINGKIPFSIKVINGGTTIATSIDARASVNEWKEVSIGFYTGSSTSVQIKLNSTPNQAATVWIDNIELNKTTPYRVLCLEIRSITFTNSDTQTQYVTTVPAGQKIMNGGGDSTWSNSNFDYTMEQITDKKAPTNTDVLVLNNVTCEASLSGTSVFNVSYPNLVSPNSSCSTTIQNAMSTGNYDFVYTFLPFVTDANVKFQNVTRNIYLGVYMGVYTPAGVSVSHGQRGDGNVGYAYIGRECFQSVANVACTNTTEASVPLDGILHEFHHYFGGINGTMNVPAPNIDEMDKAAYTATMGTAPYIQPFVEPYGYTNNYDRYYDALRRSGSSLLRFLWKYQWYSDVYNGNVPFKSTDNGTLINTYGYSARALLKPDVTRTYYMKALCGVEDGIYNIRNHNSNLSLDSTITSTFNCPPGYTTLTQQNYSGIKQLWRFKFISGYYEIIPQSDISKRLTYNSMVMSMASSGNDNQKWIISCLTDGSFKISPKNYPERVIEVMNASTQPDGAVQILNYGGYACQSWNLIANRPVNDGIYDMRNYKSGLSLDSVTTTTIWCPAGMSTLTQQSYTGINQLWKFQYKEGYYEIIPQSDSTKRLSYVSMVNAVTANGSDTQKWIVMKLANNSVIIAPKNYPARSLEVMNAWMLPAGVQCILYGGYDCQSWNLIENKPVQNGIYKIENKNSELNLDSVITTIAGCPEGTTTLTQQIYSGLNQLWRFQYKNGYYEIIPLSSDAKRLSYGTTVNIANADNSDSQKWMIWADTNGNTILAPKNNPIGALEVMNASTLPDGVQCATYGSNLHQKWNLVMNRPVADGTYNIRNYNSNLNVDSVITTTFNCPTGTSALTQQSYSGINQIWRVTMTNEGYYEITPISDITKRLTNTPTINIAPADGSDSQKWLVMRLSDGTMMISPKKFPGNSLEIMNAWLYAGGGLQAIPYGGYPCQKWNFVENRPVSDGIYKLQNENSGLLLDSIITTSFNCPEGASTLTQQSYSGLNQLWRFQYKNGYYEIIPMTNDTKRLSYASMINVANADNSDSQKWFIWRHTNGNVIIAPKNNPTKALEVMNASMSPTGVQNLSYGGYACQRWNLVQNIPVENGTYSVRNVNSNLSLDSVLTTTFNCPAGTSALTQQSFSGVNQGWDIEMTEDGYYLFIPLSDTSKRLTNTPTINIAAADDSNNQKWLVYQLPDGNMMISPKSLPGYSLEVMNAMPTAGAGIQAIPYGGYPCQKWYFVAY